MNRNERKSSRPAAGLFGRLSLACLGFLAYWVFLQPGIHIDLGDQVAPAMFAMAGIVGVFAGFAATAVVFIAGASGPSIDKMRRDHGRRLTGALLGAVTTLLISAGGLVVCGLFANGWGAKGAACALMFAPMADLVLVQLALRSAINSLGEPKRTVQSDEDV